MCKGCEPLRQRLVQQAEKTATFARATRVVWRHNGGELLEAVAEDAEKLAAEFAGPLERHGKTKSASAARPPRRAVPTPPPAGTEQPANFSDDPAQQTLRL